MKIFEIFTFADRQNQKGRQGHVAFVSGASEKDAWHTAASSIPRVWMNCGIRECAPQEVERRLDFLRSEIVECQKILESHSQT